jgi:hypothetical protein
LGRAGGGADEDGKHAEPNAGGNSRQPFCFRWVALPIRGHRFSGGCASAWSFGDSERFASANTKTNMKATILTVVAILATLTAHGQFTIYFGEDASRWPLNDPNDVPRPTVLTNTYGAAASFAAHLPGVVAETFEGFATGSFPTNISFGTNVATLSGGREILTVTNAAATFGGIFPFSGTNTLVLKADRENFFALDFSSPQAAFGFYGSDFGEPLGMRLAFISPSGGRTQLEVPITRPQGSGGAFFFGVIDRTNQFIRIEFQALGTSSDWFGFDDMTIAERVPGPELNIRVSEVELSWNSLSNETYRVEYRSELTTNTWTPLRCILGDGQIVRTYDRAPLTEPRRFYRLVLTNCVPGP